MLAMTLANDDHLLCDTTQPNGCSRCRPKVCNNETSPCCDGCVPALLELFEGATVPTQTRAAPRSSIKPYEPTLVDRNLKTALKSWRKITAHVKFGSTTVHTHSIQILMHDKIIQRIVDCARIDRIRTVEDLAKETRWTSERIKDYGVEILSIIQQHSPPPPAAEPAPSATSTIPAMPALANPQGTNPDPAQASAKRTRAPPKQRQCGECHQMGHISTFIPL